MEDIEVTEAEAFSVPELWVRDLLILQANILKFNLQLHGNLTLDMVRTLQSVRPFHLRDRQLKGLFQLGKRRHLLDNIDDPHSVLDGLLSDWIVTR